MKKDKREIIGFKMNGNGGMTEVYRPTVLEAAKFALMTFEDLEASERKGYIKEARTMLRQALESATLTTTN